MYSTCIYEGKKKKRMEMDGLDSPFVYIEDQTGTADHQDLYFIDWPAAASAAQPLLHSLSI